MKFQPKIMTRKYLVYSNSQLSKFKNIKGQIHFFREVFSKKLKKLCKIILQKITKILIYKKLIKVRFNKVMFKIMNNIIAFVRENNALMNVLFFEKIKKKKLYSGIINI